MVDHHGNPDLPPEVARSWRRAAMHGVAPSVAPDCVPSAELVSSDDRLRRAVAPLLDTLAARLSGVPAGVVLLDDRAVVLDRRQTADGVMSVLDEVHILTGSHFDEAFIGNNAGGTAVEERRPVRIIGDEHYAQMLKQFACYGVPLYRPTTRRIAGVLAVVLPETADHPLLAGVVQDAAGRIEALFADEANVRERAQMDFFMALARRSKGAVVAAFDDAVMLNRAAERVDPVDRAALVRAGRELAVGDHGMVLELGHELTVRVHTRTEDVDFRGAVLEIVPPAPRRVEPVPRWAGLPGLVGTSPAWRTLCDQARTAADADTPVLVVGGAGVGKIAVARAIHQMAGRAEVREHVLPVTGRGWWARLIADLSDPGVAVVIRNLCLGGDRSAARLIAELDGCHAGGRVIATAREQSAIRVGLLGRFPAQLRVPSLYERRDDIDLLARDLLSRRTPDPSVRLHPEALAALRNGRFEGNITELDRLITAAAAVRRVGDIMPADLQVQPETGPLRLSGIQRAERDAIVAALVAARGNKRTAASALGISRATLYRRIADFHIDVP